MLKFVKVGVKLGKLTTIQLSSAVVFLLLFIWSIFGLITLPWMQCSLDGESRGISNEVVKSFCYSQDSFLLDGRAGKVHLTYYLWVHYVMLGCFLSVFVGQLIYKCLLWGNRLSDFLNDLTEAAKEGNCEANVQLKDLMTKSRIKADSRYWMLSLITFELINSITPCLQIYFLNKLFQGKFTFLGLDIENGEYLDTLFPIKAYCDFTTYGTTGSTVHLHAVCTLSQNPLNEKIFVCASWWLIFLVVISATKLSWRVLTCMFFRAHFFSNFIWKVTTGNPGTRKFRKTLICAMSHVQSFSEWVYIYYAALNIDSIVFSSFVVNLHNLYVEIDEMELIRIANINTSQNQKHNPNIENVRSISSNGISHMNKFPEIPPRPTTGLHHLDPSHQTLL